MLTQMARAARRKQLSGWSRTPGDSMRHASLHEMMRCARMPCGKQPEHNHPYMRVFHTWKRFALQWGVSNCQAGSRSIRRYLARAAGSAVTHPKTLYRGLSKRWTRSATTAVFSRPLAARTSHAAVFWDVDNLKPRQANRQAVAEALAAAARARGDDCALEAFGNTRTWDVEIGEKGLHPALEAAGFSVRMLPIEDQAVDIAISEAMRSWLKARAAEGSTSTIILCSGDRGFEQLRGEVRRAGARTVVVANTRWSANADVRLPWVHMHDDWEGPRGWRTSRWQKELERLGGRESLSSLYRSRDCHRGEY